MNRPQDLPPCTIELRLIETTLMRFFTTEGPVRVEDHYSIPPLQRWDLDDVLQLIAQKKYFLLHAPRQTGKTSCLLALAEYLNREGHYRAVYVNIEAAQAAREDVALAMTGIVQTIAAEALWQLQDVQAEPLAQRLLADRAATVVLGQFLSVWCAQSPVPTVRRIIEPMLAGTALGDVAEDDRQYLVDLGLLRRINGGGLVIANPIYREVLPRALASAPQDSLPQITPTWLHPDGSLNPEQLLDAFLAFWRQHGQPLLGSVSYHDIAPHLVLMAFLHRVVNGGGSLEREYAIGRGRMDLCLRYGAVTLGIELKVWRDGEPDPLDEGLVQLDAYLAGLGLDNGWLVIFDQRSGQPPIRERTSCSEQRSPQGRRISVIRA